MARQKARREGETDGNADLLIGHELGQSSSHVESWLWITDKRRHRFSPDGSRSLFAPNLVGAVPADFEDDASLDLLLVRRAAPRANGSTAGRASANSDQASNQAHAWSHSP